MITSVRLKLHDGGNVQGIRVNQVFLWQLKHFSNTCLQYGASKSMLDVVDRKHSSYRQVWNDLFPQLPPFPSKDEYIVACNRCKD